MSIIDDYTRWHALQTATGDIDPAYPILRAVGSHFDRELTAWLLLHHVGHYHIGSALKSFSISPGGEFDDALYRLPTGTERRGNRDPRAFHKHWTSLRAEVGKHGGAAAFLTPTAGGHAGWRELTERIERVHGNGRWASYKLCELSQKVLGVPIAAPDAGHAFSTGPRKGLALLAPIPSGNTPSAIAELDDLTNTLAARLGERDIAQVETSLCDFHSLAKGRYYLGKDIDEQLHHLLAVPSGLTPVAMEARRLSFPPEYLAELTGRDGVDKARCREYATTGRILERSTR